MTAPNDGTNGPVNIFDLGEPTAPKRQPLTHQERLQKAMAEYFAAEDEAGAPFSELDEWQHTQEDRDAWDRQVAEENNAMARRLSGRG